MRRHNLFFLIIGLIAFSLIQIYARAAMPGQPPGQPPGHPEGHGEFHAQPQVQPHPQPHIQQHMPQGQAHPQPHIQQHMPQGQPNFQVPRQVRKPFNSVSRTPSLSRTGAPRAELQSRLQQIAKQPRGTQMAARNQIQQFLQQAKKPGAQGMQGQIKRNVQTTITRAQQQNQNRQQATLTRQQISRYHPQMKNWFNNQFFTQHNYHPDYYHEGDHWRHPVIWNNIALYLDLGGAPPIYYDDEGEPEYIEAPAPEEYPPEEEGNPSENAPEAEGDWMPIGIFAAGQDATQAAYSNMFVQLAVSRDGDIAGTYYNATTDQTHPLEGVIDPDSQLAVWKVTDNPNSPIMSTGLYNLTQDVVIVQVHFPNGYDQNWTLVRLNE